MFSPVIFREYDVRGVYNKDFDLDFAKDLGKSIVTYFSKFKNNSAPHITIGYDARLTSPEIVKSLSAGICQSGGQITHLGLVPTPVTYFTTFEMPEVDGAIMVTGSHNPPEYNGFKISVGKSTIFGKEILELKKIIESKEYLKGSGDEKHFDIRPTYIERYKKEFSGLRSIPVVIDCGNGAAGSVIRSLYEACGQNPNILFEKPDGTFPNHHPDPTVEENLKLLKDEVVKTGSLLGIGLDGDADRIVLVDENGRALYGDELMTLISRDILKTLPGQKIVGDVKCSDRLFKDIELNGGVPIMWKTGHSLIKEKIKTEGSPFGGELSGHIFFADRNYGYDDALYAGLRVIEILSKTGKTISELLTGLPPSFSTPEIRIDTSEEKKISIVKELIKAFPNSSQDYKLNLLDGIRISFTDGWALARPSNTQPVLVLRFESVTEKGLENIKSRIEAIVNPLL